MCGITSCVPALQHCLKLINKSNVITTEECTCACAMQQLVQLTPLVTMSMRGHVFVILSLCYFNCYSIVLIIVTASACMDFNILCQ